MKNKNNISETPLESTTFLSKIEKRNDFTTPKNYFEEISKVNQSKTMRSNNLGGLFDKLLYRFLLPITAITTVLIFLFYMNNPSSTSPLTAVQISEVLINENFIDLDEDLVIEAYIETMGNEIVSEENEEHINEEYINYLIENDIDINTIINEL